MQKSSKFHLFLAGLTAAALIGGVMAADPADAGKKKKKRAKAKSSKVVQVSKGGKAKAGNGGHGGKGGKSGNVYNTGNVGGGSGGVVVPGGPAGECIVDAFRAARDNGDPPGDPEGIVTVGAEFNTFIADSNECPGTIPADLLACLNAQLADGAGLNLGEVIGCLRDFPPAGGGAPAPAPSSGAVFSGDGGNGGEGGTGGNATGGDAGSNNNSSSTTVNSDNHSIDVD